MIKKYRWWELILIYAGILLFLAFMLAPFIEALMVSLRPLDQIFNIPYQFITDNMSFAAYRSMWASVPNLALYIFNSFFIAFFLSH